MPKRSYKKSNKKSKMALRRVSSRSFRRASKRSFGTKNTQSGFGAVGRSALVKPSKILGVSIDTIKKVSPIKTIKKHVASTRPTGSIGSFDKQSLEKVQYKTHKTLNQIRRQVGLAEKETPSEFYKYATIGTPQVHASYVSNWNAENRKYNEKDYNREKDEEYKAAPFYKKPLIAAKHAVTNPAEEFAAKELLKVTSSNEFVPYHPSTHNEYRQRIFDMNKNYNKKMPVIEPQLKSRIKQSEYYQKAKTAVGDLKMCNSICYKINPKYYVGPLKACNDCHTPVAKAGAMVVQHAPEQAKVVNQIIQNAPDMATDAYRMMLDKMKRKPKPNYGNFGRRKSRKGRKKGSRRNKKKSRKVSRKKSRRGFGTKKQSFGSPQVGFRKLVTQGSKSLLKTSSGLSKDAAKSFLEDNFKNYMKKNY
jgi:hypothetical protein